MNASEKIFFEKGSIKVSQTEFCVRKECFSIREIASIKKEKTLFIQKKSKVPAIVLMIFGMKFLVKGMYKEDLIVAILGGVVLLAGGIWVLQIKDIPIVTHHLDIEVSHQSKRVFSSLEEDEVQQLYEALTQAINQHQYLESNKKMRHFESVFKSNH
ncbi:DUF6232 family protein [Capnocytophaga canimorsus]|uniref:DUF6232 family protein n=1 Tax=Capnocytophaga canimorsus TaxID=28188 RepID=UPI0037CD1E74